MVVITCATVEADPAELDRVIGNLNEDNLLIVHGPDPADDGRQMVEIRTETEVLSWFHEACLEREIVLDIWRIHHGPTPTTSYGDVETDVK